MKIKTLALTAFLAAAPLAPTAQAFDFHRAANVIKHHMSSIMEELMAPPTEEKSLPPPPSNIRFPDPALYPDGQVSVVPMQGSKVSIEQETQQVQFGYRGFKLFEETTVVLTETPGEQVSSSSTARIGKSSGVPVNLSNKGAELTFHQVIVYDDGTKVTTVKSLVDTSPPPLLCLPSPPPPKCPKPKGRLHFPRKPKPCHYRGPVSPLVELIMWADYGINRVNQWIAEQEAKEAQMPKPELPPKVKEPSSKKNFKAFMTLCGLLTYLWFIGLFDYSFATNNNNDDEGVANGENIEDPLEVPRPPPARQYELPRLDPNMFNGSIPFSATAFADIGNSGFSPLDGAAYHRPAYISPPPTMAEINRIFRAVANETGPIPEID